MDKLEQVQKAIDEVTEKVEERSLAMEILVELRTNCKRWFAAFMIVLFLWAATIIGFLWYQSLWDYTTTSTYEANGIYALIDSNGNILAQDVSQEQLDAFAEWWNANGNSQTDNNQK